ncbi:MAG TPA: hypothetical protein K8V16_10200 [Rubneribacter badeniensis]|uniref:Uncharacterized protein n=1 Tax=Rubneribacter badeniensis TaxID=2070688 RepID=A0A9D3AE94_9ACTN|nr:hypothetical protein [Rubneribacter badeniensis]
MWELFFASVAVGAVFLYVPGALVIRALGAPRIVSFVCAPFVSIAAYTLLSIIYPSVGVFCSWASFAIPVFGVFAVVYAISCVLQRKCSVRFVSFGIEAPRHGVVGRLGPRFDGVCLAWYIAVGIAVTTVFFAQNISPDSFAQEFDNVHHLGVTKGYVDSGNWSPFASTLYAMQEDASINPLPGSGFYPSAWNCLSALLVSALDVPVALAGNAVNYLFIAVVLPASTFLFMRAVFRKRPSVVPFGALCVLGGTAFPWLLLAYGPLYPNLISFCLLPAAAFCFVSLFAEGVGVAERMASALLFAVSLAGFAFVQPNAVFSLGVLLAPFCVYRVGLAVGGLSVFRRRRALGMVLGGLVAAGLIAVVWYACFKAPFLQSVVSHEWPTFKTFKESFLDALLFGFDLGSMRVALTVLVALGGVFTLFKREYLWLSCSYALACALYMVDASLDGWVRHLLVGFWYTDSPRVAAFATLFAAPLAAMGLWLAAQGAMLAGRSVARLVGGRARPKRGWGASASAMGVASFCAAFVAAAAFCWINYGVGAVDRELPPQRGFPSGSLVDMVSCSYNDVAPAVYDEEERAFVGEVRKAVPSDSLILNVPDDGSAFAYAVDDLRVYYRYLRTYGGDDETEESRLIRTRLDHVASDAKVREAVREVGGEYVLLLDQGPGDPSSPRRYLFTYEDGRNWMGILGITDDTPGFEVVLAEKDMRLYRITAA